MSKRTLALPVLAASVVLSLSACDPTAPAVQSTDSSVAAAPAAPALAGTASTENPTVTLLAPAADRAFTGSSARPTASAAPKVVVTDPTPSGAPAVAAAPDLKLDSYDKKSGKVVLAVATTGKAGAPSPVS